MSIPQRISVTDARVRSMSDEAILLVSAYSQPDAWPKMGLEEAISYQELQERLPDLPKDYEIVFY